MSNTPIAATAGAARQRLASSLAALQQDPSVPAAVLNIVQGLARAMGPLFQVERGTGEPTLIFQARAVLQETLGAMQAVDQAYPGVGDATAAIAQSLGMLFAAIKEHGLVDPAAQRAPTPPAAPVVQPAPQPVFQPPPPQPLFQPPPQPAFQPPPQPAFQQPPQPAFQPPPQPAFQPPPQPAFQQPPAVPLTTPAAQAVPLTTPAAQAVPLTTPAAQAVPLVQHNPAKAPSRKERPLPATVFPETAAKVPLGPHGMPRVEAELEAFSETNFYTNFVGDIHDHGGIFVATYAVLAVGTPCEVALKFPGDYLAEFRGVVKWRREATRESNVDSGSQPGMGIEISDASAEVWALIKRFIQKREPIIQDV
jgi:hypothetical protein